MNNNKRIKNKNKRVRKIIVKYRNRRTTYMSPTMHKYILTNVLKLGNPTYTEQNMRISLNDMISENPIFLQKKNEYQYFKIIRVLMKFTPVMKGAENPPAGFIVFLGNEDLSTINYTDLPYLSYKRAISPIKSVRYVFTRPGRQPDFHYWYNTTNYNSIDAWFKLRFDEAFNVDSAYYKLETGIELIFDKPIFQSNNKIQGNENVVKSEFHAEAGDMTNTEIKAFMED